MPHAKLLLLLIYCWQCLCCSQSDGSWIITGPGSVWPIVRFFHLVRLPCV